MPYDFVGKGLNGAQELVELRQYNKKVFDIGNGQKRYLCHTAHIHYKDKADGNKMKEIDPRLVFDEVTRKHKHNKSSYHCAIPEYADDLIEFKNVYGENDQEIHFKLSAQHVKGVYHEDEKGNHVDYVDAFGDGIDLKIYSFWRGVKKVVVFNKAPKATTVIEKEVIPIDADSTMHKDSELRANVINDIGKTSLQSAKGKVIEGGKEVTEIATNITGEKLVIKDTNDTATHFNPVVFRDSDKKSGLIKTDLVVSDTKTIVKADLTDIPFAEATYPLEIEI